MLIPTYGNAGSYDLTLLISNACQMVSEVEGNGTDIYYSCQQLPYTPQQWLGLIGVA